MPNLSALFKHDNSNIADSIYLERSDIREHALEEHLRSLLARAPKLGSIQRSLQKFVNLTNQTETNLTALADNALSEFFSSQCDAIRKNGFTDELLAHAFAAVREASKRTLGLRHHDVQLMGGRALLHGTIAEMETGEGKTLVATLAACTAAAAGLAVHVITVNDYLAERDAQHNTPLYNFFGLTVGIIQQGMDPTRRHHEYTKDIVYVSNKEIVFDYLKDRIATRGACYSQHRIRNLSRRSQGANILLRGLHLAIIDEADSVLIDEARTPLIISETQPDELGEELYQTAIMLAKTMVKDDHFVITAHRDIWITTQGEHHIQQLTTSMSGYWSSSIWRRELLEKALNALWCYQPNQHYIVVDNKIQIVDEFTGRVMPDRSWERGLHQMIEAKESCEITGQRKTLSRITYQRFFRRYLLLCGMTGTAAEISNELRRVYDLHVQRIPTHRINQRKSLGNRIWLVSDQRWDAIAERATELSRAGRSVLIGTRSVEASEKLSILLHDKGIEHTVLNARQDSTEADTVALAGQPGRITVATNMAGRGTDIKLSPEVSATGGLHVILTEFHESARIDRQLFGRCARQGEPGSIEAMVSLEDEIFMRYSPLLRSLAEALVLRRGSLPSWLLKLLISQAQHSAERYNAKIRLSTLKQDRKLQDLLAFSGNPS